MKRFLPVDKERDNGFIMASWLNHFGFRPNVLYTTLRGGTTMASAIAEWYKIQPDKSTIIYAAISAHSYTGIEKREELRIEGNTYPFKDLRPDDKVLLVDDIYDSGNTIDKVAREILTQGIKRENLKIVVHSLRSDKEHPGQITPDYWCEEITEWTVYGHYELEDLTEEELQEFYIKNNPTLRQAFYVEDTCYPFKTNLK
jgi:hypoxanthine phosphoribosyltransferase